MPAFLSIKFILMRTMNLSEVSYGAVSKYGPLHSSLSLLLQHHPLLALCTTLSLKQDSCKPGFGVLPTSSIGNYGRGQHEAQKTDSRKERYMNVCSVLLKGSVLADTVQA